MTYRTITAMALVLIALPIAAVRAQPFNPYTPLTPAEWMRNCVHNFEGENKARSDSIMAMVGKPPPTHRENIQYCIYSPNADRELPLSERVQFCVKNV
jgi:hypothetical protein